VNLQQLHLQSVWVEMLQISLLKSLELSVLTFVLFAGSVSWATPQQDDSCPDRFAQLLVPELFRSSELWTQHNAHSDSYSLWAAAQARIVYSKLAQKKPIREIFEDLAQARRRLAEQIKSVDAEEFGTRRTEVSSTDVGLRSDPTLPNNPALAEIYGLAAARVLANSYPPKTDAPD